MDDDTTYKIVRRYFRGHERKVIETGLTLEEAQAHCQDPETSSKTCTTLANIQHTEDYGPWFDGYDEE